MNTMSETNIVNEQAEKTGQESDVIAQQLIAAREHKDVTLEQAHTYTRLDLHRLRLLERGDFDDIGPEVFVLGYLRKYANYLGLNADALIEEYQQARNQHPDKQDLTGVPDSKIRIDTEESSTLSEFKKKGGLALGLFKNKPAVIAIGSVIVVVVVLLMGRSGDLEHVNSVSNDVSDKRSAVLVDRVASGVTENLDNNEQEDRASNTIETAQQTNTKKVDIESVSVAQDQSVEAAGQTGIGINDIDNEALLENEPSLVLSSAAGAELELGTVTDSELQMLFSDACWVEVRDRFERVVFADLKNSGDNLRLLGQAPFSVMFGNVHGVESVSINSAPVDVVAKGSRKTLKLTIDVP